VEEIMRSELLLMLLMVGVLQATVIRVPDDQPSLAAGLAQAQSGDTVLVADGIYHEHSLLLPPGVRLLAEDAAGIGAVIDCASASWGLHLTGGDDETVVRGFHIVDGLGGFHAGGLSADSSTVLIVEDCRFSGCWSGWGSLSAKAGSRLTLRRCEFVANPGGVVSLGQLVIEDCWFHDNDAPYLLLHHGGTLRLRSCRMEGNEAMFGVFIHSNGASVGVDSVVFADNRLQEGGLLSIMDLPDDSCRVERFHAWDNQAGSLISLPGTLYGSRLVNNRLEYYLARGRSSLYLESVLFGGNEVAAPGSLALIGADSLRLSQVTIAGCSGAGPLLEAGDLTLEASLLAYNSVPVIAVEEAAVRSVTCCGIFANGGGDFVGAFEGFEGVDGNWSAEPRLVDPVLHDYRPGWVSPARPEGNSCAQLIGALAAAEAAAAPVPWFDPQPVSGLGPLAVQFSALETAAGEHYRWDFDGDGMIDAEGLEATWVFGYGRHDIELRVEGGGLTRSLIRREHVRVGGRTIHLPVDAQTLPEALALWEPGDTLELAPGLYEIGDTIHLPSGVVLRSGSALNPARLQAMENSVPAMLSTGPGIAPVTLIGFDLISSAVHSRTILQAQSATVLFRECRLSGKRGLGGAASVLDLQDCIIDWQNYSSLLSDCELYYRRCRFDGAGCILGDSFRSARFEDCEFIQTQHLLSQSADMPRPGRLELVGSTLLDCGWPGLDWLGLAPDTVRIERSLFVGQRGGLIAEESPPLSFAIERSDISRSPGLDWSGPLEGWLGVLGNIDDDPQFCDVTEGDLRLAMTSPCLADSIGRWGPGCEFGRPRALASASDSLGSPPLTVHFRSWSTGLIDSLLWDLDGDGFWDAQGDSASWTYDQPGFAAVRLAAYGPGGSHEILVAHVRVPGRTRRVPGEWPSLAAAFYESTEGDTVEVACGVYAEHNLRLPDGVVLRLEETTGEPCVTIDAQGAGFGLSLRPHSANNLLRGLRIINGVGVHGAGVVVEPYSLAWDSLFFENCVFENCVAAAAGGGIGGESILVPLVLRNCRFSGNRADQGGGLAIAARWLRVEGCRFEDNEARVGGALHVGYGLLTQGSTFRGNRAAEEGGAIWQQGNAANLLRIETSLFDGNRSGIDGAALRVASRLRLRSCTFHGDSTAAGGGVLVHSGSPFDSLRVERCIIAFATGGQALHSAAVPIAVSCSDLFGNAGGDWTGDLAGQLGLRGNIAADPLFCDPEEGIFDLRLDSPGRPEHSGCGWMGAFEGFCDGDTDLERLPGPTVFRLHPAAPNPFNPTTLLRFDLPAQQQVRLTVHNLLGQRAATLVDEELPAGSHRAVFDGSRLASGVYLLHLEAGGQARSAKVLLLK
jgi:PKD repeat protein